MIKKVSKRLMTAVVCLTIALLAVAAYFAVFTSVRAEADSELSAAAEQAQPIATYYIGAGGVDDEDAKLYNYEFFDDGWNAAVQAASDAFGLDKTAYVKVVLRRDWVAAADENGFGTGIGFNSVGRLLCPSGTNIVLDLNGKTLDRNLTDTDGLLNGYALLVNGNLTVDDSAGGGKITGGFHMTTATSGIITGGGVVVSGGSFDLLNGSIEGNKMTGKNVLGGGVAVRDGGVFNMRGGRIAGHVISSTSYGAGVGVYSSGAFNMYDGIIENNTATYGGGVIEYNVANGISLNLTGGIIRNNSAAMGGGVSAYYQGNSFIGNVEICNNTAGNSGGGVYLYAASTFKLKATIEGAHIHHNIARSTSTAVRGGGVAIAQATSKTGTSKVEAEIRNGTVINYNAVYGCSYDATDASKNASGGGIDLVGYSNTTDADGETIPGVMLKMSGGEVAHNRVYSFKKGDSAGNTDDVIDGVKTYGGGVCVMSWNESPDCLFVMSGGSIHNNRAVSGGGVSGDGSVTLSGGSITDNEGLYGGGLYLTAYARVKLSGDPVVKDNYYAGDVADTQASAERMPSNMQVAAADERRPKIVGAFKDGACIHIFVNESIVNSGAAFTQDYGKYNYKIVDGKTVYDNPYKYFVSDTVYAVSGTSIDPDAVSEQHIMVLENGELGVATKPLKYAVTYSDGSTEEFLFGDEASINTTGYNYVDCTYGDAIMPVSITAPEVEDAQPVEVKNAAGVYTSVVKPGVGAATAEFSVIVHAKELTADDVKITLSDDGFKYDGTEKVPSSYTVVYDGNTLAAGTDYTFDCEDNINAGKAYAVFTFKGNYSGVVKSAFTIATSDSPDITMRVSWEVYDGTDWKAANVSDDLFVYDGTDKSALLRAVLEIGEYGDGDYFRQTVYSADATVNDPDRNNGMYITFTPNGSAAPTAFTNAGTYTVSLVGDGNYNITDEDRVLDNAAIGKMNITLDVSDLEYQDADLRRLWHVQFQIEDGNNATRLLDKVAYVDPDAAPNEFGEKVTVGELVDAYARYRDTELSLKFNGAYKVGEQTLDDILRYADSVTYVNVNMTDLSSGTVGAFGQVHKIKTTATVTFGSNISVSGGNTLVVEKEWYIVTIGNNLRMSDGNEITALELEGWTFGDDEQLKGYAFRSEHGNTLIYTYYKAGSTEALRQFALVYSDNTLRAAKNFYELKEENGKAVVDETKPIAGANYLFAYNNTLKAGSYRLEITVPQVMPEVGEHTHWWDNTTADDLGTVYYEFTYVFMFTVDTYSISDGSAPNSGITVTYPQKSVAYNGNSNNMVKPIVMLNRKLLVEGEDYVLECERVNVGSAALTIRGINSLTGEFTQLNAFEIVKAQNSWVVLPSIMRWTYFGFNREVNLITATPGLLDDPTDLWFKITTDKEGLNVIENLEHITLDGDGLVSAQAESALKALKATVDNNYYYLFAYVKDTYNYYGLEQEPLPFKVFSATNSWEITPVVTSWTEGQYDKTKENVQAKPEFGVAHVIIKGADGKVYYDSEKNIDILGTAKAGAYTLTAEVAGTSDYSKLDVYTYTFKVFEKPGLPWWGILLIVLGSLGIAAIILWILHEKGVLQMLTGKVVIAIRTKMTVDATIAAVRANKRAEESRKSIAKAEAQDRIEAMRKAREEQRALPPEERAAVLEERAVAEAARAEKAQQRAEKLQHRANKLKGGDAPEAPETATAQPTEVETATVDDSTNNTDEE